MKVIRGGFNRHVAARGPDKPGPSKSEIAGKLFDRLLTLDAEQLQIVEIVTAAIQRGAPRSLARKIEQLEPEEAAVIEGIVTDMLAETDPPVAG